ncbi:MAG: hypothetical protein BWK73_16970 [Thiothrix lacustris]|uniref:Type I restriction modification DNA specificity domain-containing protein n=1 Tax=Thiothrix lacustris TaxID=525917 RepID=A0A1Y1QR97_9GAMM|nr:MAG: hypothetical protein BWK73_16970 [Thiothrix lacustris]
MTFRKVLLGNIAREDRVMVKPDTDEAKRRPYLGLEQIESQTGRITSYDNDSIEGKSTTFAFDNRHVLYGKLRPYLNKVAMPETEGRCSTEIIPLLPVDVDRDYLALLLRTEALVNAAMSKKTGSRMPRADMSMLFGFTVTIHTSIEEQRRIAAALKAQLAEVEKVRAGLEAQHNDVKTLKSAVFQQVFEAIAQTNRKRIGDIANTTSGTTPSRSNKAYWKPAIHPWVKTGEVAFAPITQTEEAVSAQALKECSLSLLPVGTVLVAMYGQGKTRGQSAVLQVPATTNQACFAILPNEQFEPQYLQYWLQYSYPDMRALSDSRGGNQSNLNGSMLNDFEMPLIPLEKQRQVVKMLEQALAEVSRLEEGIQAQQAEVALLPARLLAQAFGA